MAPHGPAGQSYPAPHPTAPPYLCWVTIFTWWSWEVTTRCIMAGLTWIRRSSADGPSSAAPHARATKYEPETYFQNWEKSSELINMQVKYFPKSLEKAYIKIKSLSARPCVDTRRLGYPGLELGRGCVRAGRDPILEHGVFARARAP